MPPDPAGPSAAEGVEPTNTALANFKPYIPSETVLPELTVGPLIMGTLLGIVFGASSLYLVLKVGLTVSASIPVAVISIAVFRLLSKLGFRNRNILEVEPQNHDRRHRHADAERD